MLHGSCSELLNSCLVVASMPHRVYVLKFALFVVGFPFKLNTHGTPPRPQSDRDANAIGFASVLGARARPTRDARVGARSEAEPSVTAVVFELC